jgi:hypothetical protein
MSPYHAVPVVWCPSFMDVTPSFTHVSLTFYNQRFSLPFNCGCWTCEVNTSELLWKQRLQGEWTFSSAATDAVVVLWIFETGLLLVMVFSVDFVLTVPLPMIHVGWHNLRNYHSQYIH